MRRNLREIGARLLSVPELLVEVLCLLVEVVMIIKRLVHHRLALALLVVILTEIMPLHLLLFSLSKVVVDKMEGTLSRATLGLSKRINSLIVMANTLLMHRILAILQVTILKQLVTKSRPTSKINNRGRIRCRHNISFRQTGSNSSRLALLKVICQPFTTSLPRKHQ
jgi:hypothetical protein